VREGCRRGEKDEEREEGGGGGDGEHVQLCSITSVSTRAS
jgi:hypothetical protein